MTPAVLLDAPAAGGERLRLTVTIFNGRPVIQLRRWYLDGDGEWRPGKAGVPIAAAIIEDLCDALEDARRIVASAE